MYAIRSYYDGEFYDLKNDPGELKNLWDIPEMQIIKNELLLKFLHCEMIKSPRPMPRIAGA